jgi:16S rRNA processing protein RimM
MPASDEWMLIGEIAGPFGVRGEIKIDPLTDYPERFESTRHVYLGPSRDEYRVERARLHKRQVLAKLAGIDTPEQVEALRRQEVLVPRAEAADLPEGHYYLDDLLGVEVLTADGRMVGAITDIIRTGSNDVYVVGEGRDAVLIPAIKGAITDLDLTARRVVIEPWVLDTDEG